MQLSVWQYYIQKYALLKYNVSVMHSGGQSTQIKYLSKSTDRYNKILLQ